ncbi:flagellar biosynthesis protein FlhF [Gottfriedia luciferensis]|uniref:flagellar biosynthesis protein FlhF n=1 Tax=Gottfriedia luciferensis TaxID=178774 RepID=UPI000B44DC6E|nr:flagellar biosynthesis protein FlhF [Gottfriedia luciferensis]
MRVKKITAPTMSEAMKKVTEELGQNAVILNTRVIQEGGIFGFFSRKKIELIAALDQNQPEKKPIKTDDFQEGRKFQNQIDELLPEMMKTYETSIQPKEKSTTELENESLLKEMKQLKSMISKLGSGEANEEILHPFLDELKSNLLNQDILEELIEEIIKEIKPRMALQSNQVTTEQINEWLSSFILSKINGFKYGHQHDAVRFVNVVGPTGVGKTTTLAKIAAEAVLKYRKKVAFITTDTYRIAAIDQLKTYANILGVPIEVCYNLEDFKLAKEKFEQYDLVLIDTSGRNFRDEKYVTELKKIVDFNELETYLVLALTSKYKDMKKIFEQFHSIPIEKVIFSKVDETESYGSILNFIIEKQVGVAYLTNGQNVPDDIVEGSPNKIYSILAKEVQL